MKDEQQHWESLSGRLAFRVNLGWWLDRWLPMALALSLAASASVLALRILHQDWDFWPWTVLAVLLLAAMILAWWLARARFESRHASRVRLEDALGLHARLTAASQGVGAWPALPEETVRLPLTWRWHRPAGILAFAAVVLLLASWLPVPRLAEQGTRVIEKPVAVRQVENWVEQLRKEDAVRKETLDEVEKKMEDLLKRPGDQWYEHASLEAAENLRDQTGRQLQELGSNMEQAQATLGTLAEMGGELSQQAREGLAGQLKQNLQGLRSGAMQAGDDLSRQLRDMDASSIGKEQMEKLRQRLKQNASALREALANAPQFSFDERPGKAPGDSTKDGEGDPQRGRADASLTVKRDATNLHTTRTEAIKPEIDPERVAPGDLLGTTDGRHSFDKNPVMGAAGGHIDSAGEGGAAVWKESLIPSEREVLRRYVK